MTRSTALLPWMICAWGWARAAELPPPALNVSSCTLPDVSGPARCGTLEVPEDPAKPGGRRITVGFAIIPATGARAEPDPVAVLMGGPGEDAISMAAHFARQFEPLRSDRDVLLLDQRGTGRSNALNCNMYEEREAADNLRDFLPIAAVRRCLAEVRRRANLEQYSFAHFAADLEAVRRALGYQKLNLSAGSYGTRAAQVYLRAYPGSVRTVYFGSVVPLDVTIPVPMAGAAQAALDKTLEACAADAACRAAFPNLATEFREVMSRLAAGVDVQLPGTKTRAPLDAGRVAEWLRAKLYRAEGAAEVPWLIHRAHEGDYSPMAEGILEGARARDEAGTAINFGLLFAITCNDDIPFIDEVDVKQASAHTFLGDYRVRQQQSACAKWPRNKAVTDYRQPVTSEVPAMFVSGDSDPATPLAFTGRVAPNFPHRIEIVLAGRGHTEWSDCVGDLYEKFVRAGDTRELAGSQCPAPDRPAFRTQ